MAWKINDLRRLSVCHVIGDKSLLLTEKKHSNRSLAQIGNINVLTSKIPFAWQLDLSWTHFRLISSSDTARESSWQARVVFDFSGRLMKTLKLLWSKRFKLKREYGVNIYGLFCFIACGWSLSRAHKHTEIAWTAQTFFCFVLVSDDFVIERVCARISGNLNERKIGNKAI